MCRPRSTPLISPSNGIACVPTTVIVRQANAKQAERRAMKVFQTITRELVLVIFVAT